MSMTKFIKNKYAKYSLVFLVFIFIGSSVLGRAQTINLNSVEIAKLQRLVQTDSSAAKRFSFFQKTADDSLNDSPDPISRIGVGESYASHS